MDRSTLKKRFVGIFKEYRYAAVILAAGLILMLLPTGKKDISPDQAPAADLFLIIRAFAIHT